MNGDREIRPVTLLVSAIGGEGGGVLAGWIVAAAERHGLAVQSTSIPGVAQRTGATTYYIEMFPVPVAELDGREPVLALYPGIGDVDVMLASEFVEAGRAIANGFVTPDRTTLIASTHRVFAIAERGAMGDGRFDSERVFEAAAVRSKAAMLGDLETVARINDVSFNAVLLGVLAASGLLPVPRAAFEAAIEASGITVEANLRGFDVGFVYPFGPTPTRPLPDEAAKRPRRPTAVVLERRISEDFAKPLHDVLRKGVRRLVHYQNAAYGGLYLDRMAGVAEVANGGAGNPALCRETARYLAVRMSFEDVIRVAQLKTEPGRYERVREEVRAKQGEPVAIVEYLKPGMDELCSVLPSGIARWLLGIAERGGWRDRVNIAMRIRTTTVTGFLLLRLLALLRFVRKGTWRYGEEQSQIDEWLALITQAAVRDGSLALEIAQCARLIKGYGDTNRWGCANWGRIRDELVRPALAGAMNLDQAADAVANARIAALAAPNGDALSQVLSAIGQEGAAGTSRAAE